MRNLRTICGCSLAVGVSLGGMSLVCAQQASLSSSSSSPAQEVGLEEIRVTARRVTESLQDAPVSVTAMSRADLETHDFVDLTDLRKFVPNLGMNEQPAYIGSMVAAIRGISESDSNGANDAPVAVYVDGVYMGRERGSLLDLADIEQVEVLRGPQGTLFGRNTTGGAISVTTRTPGQEFGLSQKLGYGTYNDFTSRTLIDTGAIFNTPLRATFGYQHHENNGWPTNTLSDAAQSPNARHDNSYYFALVGDFDPVSFAYHYDRSDIKGYVGGYFTSIATGATLAYFSQSPKYGGLPYIVGLGWRNNLAADDPSEGSFNSEGHSLVVTAHVNDAVTIKSISGYRDYSAVSSVDLSGQGGLRGPVVNLATGAIAVQRVNPFAQNCDNTVFQDTDGTCDRMGQHQFSEELQSSGTIGDFSYVGGVFYFDEKVHEALNEDATLVAPASLFGLPPNPLLNYTGGLVGYTLIENDIYSADNSSEAAYTHGSWRPSWLDKKFELSVGLRYTQDRKILDTAFEENLAQPPARDLKKTFDSGDWSVSAKYDFSKDLMTYLSVATGYRAGGFSLYSPINQPYKPENEISYEWGAKFEGLDHRLRLNGDVFYMVYSNKQITQVIHNSGGTENYIANAGKASYTGFELESVALPTPDLALDANVGYVHPKWITYFYASPGSNITTNLVETDPGVLHFPYVSEWTLSTGAQYSFHSLLGNGVPVVRMDWSYKSKKDFNSNDLLNPFNAATSAPPEELLSASIKVTDIQIGAAKAEVEVYGKNLLDRHNVIEGIDLSGLGFGVHAFDQPRVFGINVFARFGSFAR